MRKINDEKHISASNLLLKKKIVYLKSTNSNFNKERGTTLSLL